MNNAWAGPYAPAIKWSSGLWSLELRGDEIADISYDGRVALRSIRSLIRDRDWNTPTLSVYSVLGRTDSLVFAVKSSGFGSDFDGAVTISIDGETAIFKSSLTSNNDFLANRIGFNVLHPAEVAGAKFELTHSDTSVEKSSFPIEISPNQPAFDIAGLNWTHNGLDVNLEFDGDVFEMEDQRNWTDASFKTYSRPLALPYPYEIRINQTVRQILTLTVSGERPQVLKSKPKAISLSKIGDFPQIQLGASSAPDSMNINHKFVKDADNSAQDRACSVILVELDLQTQNWKAALFRAKQSNLPLDLRIVCSADVTEDQIAEVLELLEEAKLLRVATFDAVSHVSVTSSSRAAEQALASANLNIPLIGGARSHFTELNRNHEHMPANLAGITFSSTPLFHSLSTEQLVESVAMQRLTVLQAVKIANGKSVHVGPITLRPRFNNVATAITKSPNVRDLSLGYGAQWFGFDDERQSSPELGAWTIASAAAFAVDGVQSITFFEEWGPRGVETADGQTLEVKRALIELTKLEGGQLLSGNSPDGFVWSVGSIGDLEATVLVANLNNIAEQVQIDAIGQSQTVNVFPFSWQKVSFKKR